jgi:transposase
MLKYSLGLDMACSKFDACLSVIDATQKVRILASRQFSNNEKGFKELVNWIQKNYKQKEIPLVVCMEATGIYYERCSLYLFKAGFSISIILPNKAKKYLQSLGLKSKNDSIDAKGLAQMGAEQNLPLWEPMGEYFYVLRSLTRQLQNVQELKTIASNQLHASELAMHDLKFILKQHKKLIVMYDKMISDLTAEITKHLKSDDELYEKIQNIVAIKGVGLLTVAVLLAESNGFELFTSASQLVSYAGYDVVENQSGKHTGKTRMSKKGNSRIRRVLHMPAFNVVKYKEPAFANLYSRVYGRSKIKMKAYVAVQKKILVIVYALWKNNEKYDVQKVNNSRDEELETSSPLQGDDKKVVPILSALHKVINSVDVSQFDSSPLEQS